MSPTCVWTKESSPCKSLPGKAFTLIGLNSYTYTVNTPSPWAAPAHSLLAPYHGCCTGHSSHHWGQSLTCTGLASCHWSCDYQAPPFQITPSITFSAPPKGERDNERKNSPKRLHQRARKERQPKVLYSGDNNDTIHHHSPQKIWQTYYPCPPQIMITCIIIAFCKYKCIAWTKPL